MSGGAGSCIVCSALGTRNSKLKTQNSELMIPKTNKKRRRIWAVESDQIRRKQDLLASEEPLELLLRAGPEQRTVAITMRTPGDDYELAAGFLHNEGVIHTKNDLAQMTYCVDGAQQEYN